MNVAAKLKARRTEEQENTAARVSGTAEVIDLPGGAKAVTNATENAAFPPLGAVQAEANAERAKSDTAATREAIKSVEIFLDQRGEVRIRVGSEAVLLDSQRGLDHIRMVIFDKTNRIISDELLRREVAVPRAKVLAANQRKTVFKRIGSHGDGIVIDCGGNRGIYVKPGSWEECEHDGALFVRGCGYGDLPSPVRPSFTKAAMTVLKNIMVKMGIPKKRQLVLIVALVNALRPGVPYVVILLIGGAGSGKSTAAGNLGGFIDPTSSGELPNVPLNAQDIAAVGQESHVVGLDNLSKLSSSGSDLLCMGANGSEFVVREFNTRKETTRLHVHCQFIITAITNPVIRGDLLDRTMPITLEMHDDYKGEDEIRTWFHHVQPVAIGALVELLAAALVHLPNVKPQRRWTHRLVDFCQLGESIVQACGDEPGSFIEEFNAMRNDAAEEAASGDPVIQQVLKIVRKLADEAEAAESFPSWRKWGGTGCCAIKINDERQVAITAGTLREKVRDNNLSWESSRGWIPQSDKQMADVLLQKTPTLSAINIQVKHRCFNGSSGAAWVFTWSI